MPKKISEDQWKKWRAMYVVSGKSLDAISRMPGAPSPTSLRLKSSEDSWVDARKDYRLARNFSVEIQLLKEIQKGQEEISESIAKLQNSKITNTAQPPAKATERKASEAKDYGEIVGDKIKALTEFGEGSGAKSKKQALEFSVKISSAAFSDPYLSGTPVFSAVRSLFYDPLSDCEAGGYLAGGESLGGWPRPPSLQVPCGLAVVGSSQVIANFMQMAALSASSEPSFEAVTKELAASELYSQVLVFLHVIDCPVCLSKMCSNLDENYWKDPSVTRFIFYLNAASQFLEMKDTWAFRLREYLPKILAKEMTIFDCMKREDRPLFRPHFHDILHNHR